jgi:hypothetical protein
MNPTHDPMTYPLPRLLSFSVKPHHMDQDGVRIHMITLNNKEASIIRFTIEGNAASYGSGAGLYEVMYSGGDAVEGFCNMSKVSKIIHAMSLETD